MRALVWIALAGCGRFGFGASDDAPTDGPQPTCTGHDEDGDGFPDACDVCPTVFDPGQRDVGELVAAGEPDGVGDACDPRPASSGDYILRFENHADVTSALYTQYNLDVAWQPDALRLGTAATAGVAIFHLDAYPSRIAFVTHVVDVSPMIHWFGVWYNRHPTAGNPKIFANGAGDATSAVFTLKEQDDSGGQRFCANASGPATFMPGDSYTFVADTTLVTGGDHYIIATSPAASWSCTLPVFVTPYNDGFLETNRMTIDFDYFIAYGIR